MKFAFYTLGCKVNQFETQAMEQRLLALGHTLGSFTEPCDGYIINTCTVTAVADKKNRSVIRRCRRENPQAVVGVCGCYAQVSTEDVRKLEVDVIGGSAGREEFLQMMLQAVERRVKLEQVDEALKRRKFEMLPAGGLEERTRAMLKVQDGCNNFCSYCIIPYARGPVRSEPLESAVAQAKALAEKGYREIVVTGIEIASWGWDFKDGSGLTDLLEALCQALPGVRIRLGSLEPRIITEEFCKRLSVFDNLCPQFHLSLQSGSDTVLKRMRRKYDTGRYLESVRLLRQYFPGCAVTTDLIVGFPGETEAELLESLAFMKTCGFAAMHIFPYSRRPGTPAATMPGQVDKAEKEARSARAIALAAELEREYLEAMVGSVQPVLFEEPATGNLWTGHAPNYAKIYAPGRELHNQIQNVKITGLYEDGLLGELAL
ncbi:MAG: tRNA (N(6)-L-threonylcarbamoyladenosine(37)-C(2))-methylthiotransferase MtaB [Faecousia sp.]